MLVPERGIVRFNYDTAKKALKSMKNYKSSICFGFKVFMTSLIFLKIKLLDRIENKETGDLHEDLQVHIPATHYKNAEVIRKIILKSI